MGIKDIESRIERLEDRLGTKERPCLTVALVSYVGVKLLGYSRLGGGEFFACNPGETEEECLERISSRVPRKGRGVEVLQEEREKPAQYYRTADLITDQAKRRVSVPELDGRRRATISKRQTRSS
jgi:hypothetical protein